VATSSTAYPSAQPTNVASSTLAAQTSTMVQAAASSTTTTTLSKKFSAQPTTQKVDATVTTLVTPLQSTPTQGNTHTSSQATQGSGSGGTVVPSDGALRFVLQAWVGLLACFIIFIVVL
jgi:hypothetical protein